MKQLGNEIEVTVYSDPLCCWSWAFQSQLQQLKDILGKQAVWISRMGGLIPSWNNFHDELNSVTRPSQMGPIWMHAGQMVNMPINHQIWMKDPPASSYPACIAVKCAQLQSSALGDLLLELLREACMIEGKNIAKRTVIFDIVRKLARQDASLDVNKFADDYVNDKGIEAFRADLDLVRYYNINRFPTLIIKSQEQKAIIISGYRHHTEILKAIEALTHCST